MLSTKKRGRKAFHFCVRQIKKVKCMQKKWTVLGGRRAYNLYCQSSRFFIITERYVCISLIILISFLADNLATHIIIPVDRCFFGQPILCKEFSIVFIVALNKIPHIFQFLFEQHILKKSESTQANRLKIVFHFLKTS